MKKLTLILTAAVLIVLAMQGCEKQQITGPVDEVAPKIKSSNAKVYTYDAGDTLLFTGATATDSLKWTITPETSTYVRQKGNVAVVVFGKAGSYTVKAQKVSGGASATTTITVLQSPVVAGADTVTTKSDILTTLPDTTEIVPITADVRVSVGYGSRINGKAVLGFSPYIYLNNNYCRYAQMQYKSSFTPENGFILDLINIRQTIGCTIYSQPTTITTPGPSTPRYDVFTTRLFSVGSYPLKIRVGTTVYTGSVVVSPTNTVINWPYTSGVIINPNVFNN